MKALTETKTKEIMYLDSLNSDGSDILAQIKTYLAEEHQTKKNSPLNLSDWKVFNFPNTPQQTNLDDCGVYMCQFAKTIANNENIEIKSSDIPNLREEMCYEILTANLI